MLYVLVGRWRGGKEGEVKLVGERFSKEYVAHELMLECIFFYIGKRQKGIPERRKRICRDGNV